MVLAIRSQYSRSQPALETGPYFSLYMVPPAEVARPLTLGMHQNFANQPLWNDHNHTVRASIDHPFQVPLIDNWVVPLLIVRE